DRGQGGQDQGPADGLGPSSQGTPQSSARSSGGVRPRGSCLQAKGVGTGGGTGQGGGRERRRRTSRPRAPARGRVGAQAQPLQGSREVVRGRRRRENSRAGRSLSRPRRAGLGQGAARRDPRRA